MAACGSLLLIIALLIAGHDSAKLKGKFVQFNDIHYDPTYLYGSGESCNIVLGLEQRRPYGNYDCDASWNLTKSALYKVDMESSIVDTDFIIWAGDIVTHVREPDMLDADKVLAIINTTAHLMKERVRSDVPIYPMLGNHDFFPKNQLPEHDAKNKNDFYSRLADVLCPLFIGKDSCVLFRQTGFYSKVLGGRLRVIIMNSNLYSVNNNAVAGPDPAGQFAWLRAELKQAQTDGQKVHVFAHIPPGMLETADKVPMFKPGYNANFNQVLRDFSSVVLGVYCGHTHTDSFRIIYSEATATGLRTPLVPMLISPAVTPLRWVGKTVPRVVALARNPALRTVHYDVTGQDIVLKDYIQFYLPLDRANSGDVQTVVWEEEYRFGRSYSVSDLTAQSLHKVATDFRKIASDNFHKYFDLNSVSIHENEDKPGVGRYYCGCKCKARHICTIENLDYEDYEACLRDDMPCAACSIRSFLFIPVVAVVMTLRNVLF